MSAATSYFDWLERRTRPPRRRRPLEDVENGVAPSEPLEVPADSTISRRIREALLKRFRSP